jgi:flagellar protein FlaG
MEVKGVVSRVEPINFSNRYTDGISPVRDMESISPSERDYTEENLIRSIELANDKVVVFGKRFEFSIHQETKHIMVKVIDVATNEVIREIPPEKILDLIASLWEIAGLIVDERV